MMHPNLVAALATEHRADLLRVAAEQRLARPARHGHPSLGSRTAKAVAFAATALRHRTASRALPVEVCCA